MQKRLKIGWGGGSGKLYAVGYRGSVVFCTHGRFVVIRYPPILENEQATDSAGSYDDRRRWVSPQTAHQAVQASIMFTCTIATLVGNISRSHEELTGILGPMVAAGRGALNSNFGHYCQARYERFLKRPKPPPRRRERKRQGDASCFNSALEVSIIPGPDDNSPPAVIAVLRKNPGKYYAVKCFPSRGYTQVPGVISPDLSDGFFAVTIWARFLTEAGIGINPGHSYWRMADYGELQVPPSPLKRSRGPQSGPRRRISEIHERIGRRASVSNLRDQAPTG